jgi:hypothetical protein
MESTLENEVLQDNVAVSLARAMATANKCARELGVDVLNSLITITQHALNGDLYWRINFGVKKYIGRRGGDLIIDVDQSGKSIRKVLRGQ